jgi:hypothetical protein
MSFTIPSGTLGTKPVLPMVGAQRFNTVTNSMEVYDGVNWQSWQAFMQADVSGSHTLGAAMEDIRENTWYSVTVKSKGESHRHKIWNEMDEWCTDICGQGATGFKDLQTNERLQEIRWFTFAGKFYFREKEDMLMFVMRWS